MGSGGASAKSASVSHYLDERGEPWFLGRDVCEYLEIVDTADAVTRVWDENKTKRTAFLQVNPGRLSQPTGVGTPVGQDQEMWFVNEPGLYQLIFQSKKKSAIDFQRWVFNELLPTMRVEGRGVVTSPHSQSASPSPFASSSSRRSAPSSPHNGHSIPMDMHRHIG